MKRRTASVSTALAASALLLSPARVRAAEPPQKTEGWEPGHRTTSRLPSEIDADSATGSGDGVYGRFDGLFDLGLEIGAAFDSAGPAGSTIASVHYMFMAGIYAGYIDALGAGRASSTRSVAFGVDLRPAFIPRWSNDMQSGTGIVDLVIDSISFGVGGYFRTPKGEKFGNREGLELSLSCGAPILRTVDGPWVGVRGLLRWDDPGQDHGPSAEAIGVVSVGWHFMLADGSASKLSPP